jgi:hypothetical protein
MLCNPVCELVDFEGRGENANPIGSEIPVEVTACTSTRHADPRIAGALILASDNSSRIW